ncbi:hypothetical protein SDRG_01388 [Saprolegnia diclina VS20]|uniref:Uncharacterized protein n=1 Tax=Saprolegnia diclina (strain VS20) TaxID=1156394 RepID=T0QTC3_SAPDV|nr:hypothetical protein SDRG_01388 [Saprolegnia diclina VS20]EQC41419.1 hypothetical protein SDRG_01388 [Saprolegnia diclina VS20]|eukprot:XP_008605133.1 hypothetical protein SDRG_01388 [Saprolegnia diclina VS20]
MNLPRMHEPSAASSDHNRGQLHSDAIRRLSSMKEVDRAHLVAVRQDAMRLVTEGIVEVDMESPASYDRQGDLAYYSEESLQLRLALRENPLLLRLTQTFWSLTNVDVEATMTFTDYSDIMVRVHKILNEHFDAQTTLLSIEDDWASDTKGTNVLPYDAFHLSLYELVDLWCDSVKVDDYVSLLYLILTGITNVEDHHLFFREVQDVLYVDVTEGDQRTSMADIELALDDLNQIGPKRPVKPSSPKPKAKSATPVAPLSRVESPPPREPSPRKKDRGLTTPATDGEEVRAEVPQRTSSPDRKTTTTPGLRLTTPATAPFNAKTVTETTLFPMEGTAPVVADKPASPPKDTKEVARARARQVENLPAIAHKDDHEQTTDVVDDGSDVTTPMTTHDEQEKLVDAAPLVRRRSTVIATVESVPLVRRDFGGFSIMSARDDAGPSYATVTVIVSRQIPKDDGDDDTSDATTDALWRNERDPKRDEAIAKAFSVQNRASLTRPLTPPSFSGPFASPPKRVETERVHGRQGARKLHEAHVEKVHALAQETLGGVEETRAKSDAEPPQISSALGNGTTGLREVVDSAVIDDDLCVQVPPLNASDLRSERRRSSSVSVEDKIKLTALLAAVRLQWHSNTESVGTSVVESLQGQTIARLPPMTHSPPKPLLATTPPATISSKVLPAIESPPKESQLLEPQPVTPRAKLVQRLVPDPLVRKFRVRKEALIVDPPCSPGRQAKTLEAISTISSPPKLAQSPEKTHPKGSYEPVHLTPLALSTKGSGATPRESQPPLPAKVEKKSHKPARVQHEGSMKFIALVKPQAPSATDFVHITAVVPALNQ